MEEKIPVRMVKIAAIQMESRIGDPGSNVNKATEMVERAASQRAKIICLPELFNTGYFCVKERDPRLFELAESVCGTTITALSRVAKEHALCIIAPIFERTKVGTYYNTAVVIGEKGDVLGVYRKTHIPYSAVAWEKFFFRPGYDYPVFQAHTARIGVLICRDRYYPEVARCLALAGAEIIFIPSATVAGASPEQTTYDAWSFVLRTRAAENEIFICGVCACGKTAAQDVEIQGESMLVGPQGEVLASLGREEGMIVHEIDLNWIHFIRQRRHLFRDRRPETYGAVLNTV